MSHIYWTLLQGHVVCNPTIPSKLHMIQSTWQHSSISNRCSTNNIYNLTLQSSRWNLCIKNVVKILKLPLYIYIYIYINSINLNQNLKLKSYPFKPKSAKTEKKHKISRSIPSNWLWLRRRYDQSVHATWRITVNTITPDNFSLSPVGNSLCHVDSTIHSLTHCVCFLLTQSSKSYHFQTAISKFQIPNSPKYLFLSLSLSWRSLAFSH